ncbi:MAG TPA: mechanosensitive ion channel domain-containing protein [Steroidobacteraceae bacterium]|jgi:small-conductance mechanosensitive channel|nr:mechanosensitive ion channel domain-containing protein [Steroidobacteraceae bacterium]
MDRIYDAVTTVINGWIGRGAVWGPITWGDLAVICGALLLAMLLHALVAAGIRQKMRLAEVKQGKELQHHTYAAVSRPLYALIWICGGYFVVLPVLSKFQSGLVLALLRRALVELFDLSVFVLLFWFLFRFTHVLETHMAKWASRSRSRVNDLFVPLLGKGMRVILPVVGVIFALPILHLPSAYAGLIAKGTSILLIVTAAVLLVQAVQVGQQAVLSRFDITAADNLRARRVYTQIHVISRAIYVVIGVFTVACILMMFQEVRHVGSSLLASAGIVGIIAGVAGQKSLANLFAGFQIALAQPMRQDDVVIVEGEWGRIEEITLTYVVVHIWDDRRLVLPLSYFIDKPFQNWTRTSAKLLGSIFIWVDYSFPVEEGRKALKQIIEGSPLWDKRFWNLQVSDASEKTMQLRVLATSADSSKSWDLRCEVREKFIAYVQSNHPQSLPQLRMQIGASDATSRSRAADRMPTAPNTNARTDRQNSPSP